MATIRINISRSPQGGFDLHAWSEPFQIINNTFVSNTNDAIDNWGDRPFTCINNIIIDNAGSFFARPHNNNSFGNQRNFHVGPNGLGVMTHVNGNGIPCDRFGNMSVDPGFVGGDPFSYELRPNSPCIDIGYPELPPDEDDTRRDLGAFPTCRPGAKHRATRSRSMRM